MLGVLYLNSKNNNALFCLCLQPYVLRMLKLFSCLTLCLLGELKGLWSKPSQVQGLVFWHNEL
jgi:hypothetical protein